MTDDDFKAPDSVNDALLDLTIQRGEADRKAKEQRYLKDIEQGGRALS